MGDVLVFVVSTGSGCRTVALCDCLDVLFVLCDTGAAGVDRKQ